MQYIDMVTIAAIALSLSWIPALGILKRYGIVTLGNLPVVLALVVAIQTFISIGAFSIWARGMSQVAEIVQNSSVWAITLAIFMYLAALVMVRLLIHRK